MPKVVIPVRAGGEWLGSIWAVVEERTAHRDVADDLPQRGDVVQHEDRPAVSADHQVQVAGVDRVLAFVAEKLPKLRQYRTPVIANARCDVLLGQCLRSNGGLFYGEAGHGVLGQLQRNEYVRYSREIRR